MKKLLFLLLTIVSFCTSEAQLQNISDSGIVVNIPPANVGGAQIARKAHCNTISIEPDAQKVTMYIDVVYYANDGTVITSPGISKYTRQSVADNSTLVDVTDSTSPYYGIPLVATAQEYITTDSTGPHLNPALVGLKYMKEYDFFYKRMHQLVSVYDLAVSKIYYFALTGKLD